MSEGERKLRGGVAGAGAFGAIHAGKYAGAVRATLAAVFDVEFDRARAVADGHGAAAFDDFDAFLDAVDVVTVATPARAHGFLSLRALEASKHVLVEKPVAATHAEGASAVAAAKGRGLTLAVGHQERLVFETMGLLAAPERPLIIEARREGPWSGRGDDVSVTLDLAIHDADLAMRLVGGGAPVSIHARGTRARSAHFDTIESEATFADGAVVRLAASRVADARRRTMRIVYPSGELEIDFVARTFRNGTPFALDAGFADTPVGKDPLGANVARFLDAAVGAAPRPAVTGEEALAALDLILAVDEAAGA
jgi:predicted dehydrogenase